MNKLDLGIDLSDSEEFTTESLHPVTPEIKVNNYL